MPTYTQRSLGIISQSYAAEMRAELLSGLLEVPLTSVEALMAEIWECPDLVEDAIQSLPPDEGQRYPPGHAGLLLALLSEERTDEGMNLPRWAASAFVVEVRGQPIMQPDVVYECNGVEIEVAASPRLQAPAGVPQASGRLRAFYVWLVGQHAWMVTALMEAYRSIGDVQRRFLLTRDPEHLVPFGCADLGSRLPYCESTYYRLLRHRSVALSDSHGKDIFPARLLLPSEDTARLYVVARRINSALERECIERAPLSDAQIALMIPAVARRTIAKYRGDAGIPPAHLRLKAYQAGRQHPYVAKTEFDVWFE